MIGRCIRFARDLAGGALLGLAAFLLARSAREWIRTRRPVRESTASTEPAARYGVRLTPLSPAETSAARAREWGTN